MRFYEIDEALQEAIEAGDKAVRVRIGIDFAGGGCALSGGQSFESVFEQDVLEADFYGLKEAAGGTSARGEVFLDNPQGIYSYTREGAGTPVTVSFSMGEGLPWFERFVFYIDDNGIQDIRGPGRKRFVRLGLRDLSARLRKTDEARDWTAPAVFAYSVICDKSQPGRSLVHGIAKRAGLSVSDIDCCTIPVTLPYVRLRKDIWAELSELATAYRCHLECAPEKPLVFAHSPYQAEPLLDDEVSYTFRGEDIFYLRKTARAEFYRNTVRLKINLPVVFEKQEIWRYEEAPVLYDDVPFGKPNGIAETQGVSAQFFQRYPFKYPLVREIEAGEYEGRYRIRDSTGKERAVVYADQIDTKEEAESRLEYEGGPFSYSAYDVTTYPDRAMLTLHKDADGDLYKASIYGRPIVLDVNRSCFMRDEKGIAAYGTAALNVTGSYFSEYEIDGKPGTKVPHYEDWVVRELAERTGKMTSMSFSQYGVSQSETPPESMVTAPSMARREITVKTHRGLFHARVGAKVQIQIAKSKEQGANSKEKMAGKITGFHLRYRKNEAFVSTFKIMEGGKE
jgi:hypothetical protein